MVTPGLLCRFSRLLHSQERTWTSDIKTMVDLTMVMAEIEVLEAGRARGTVDGFPEGVVEIEGVETEVGGGRGNNWNREPRNQLQQEE